MSGLVLIENISPVVANLISEEKGDKSMYLHGIFLQAECVNGNGRNYPLNEIAMAVNSLNSRIKSGQTVFGELNHPDNLQIDLNNVSHIITEMYIQGNNAIGKAKILDKHPKGQIVKAILEGGGRLGVSSRGTGNVNEGVVSGYAIVTVDIVANPSAQDAYPGLVMESLGENKKIMTLAESVIHDPAAQKYFRKELAEFFEKMTGQQLRK